MNDIMQEFEKLLRDREEYSINIKVDFVKAWLPGAIAREKIRMLEEMEEFGLIKMHTYDSGEGISIYDKYKNRLKAEIEGK